MSEDFFSKQRLLERDESELLAPLGDRSHRLDPVVPAPINNPDRTVHFSVTGWYPCCPSRVFEQKKILELLGVIPVSTCQSHC